MSLRLTSASGVSQVLPVITQSLLSRGQKRSRSSNPRSISTRASRRNSGACSLWIRPPYGNRFLIETHSEHLLLRLQRLIREHVLAPDHVVLIYVHRGKGPARVLHIPLGDDGQLLDTWPGGFFEEGFREGL